MDREDVRCAERDGQTRVWWEGAPVDIDRKKDWIDIESIAEVSSTAITVAAEAVAELVPAGDPRVDQLRALVGKERTTEVLSLKKAMERRSGG